MQVRSRLELLLAGLLLIAAPACGDNTVQTPAASSASTATVSSLITATTDTASNAPTFTVSPATATELPTTATVVPATPTAYVLATATPLSDMAPPVPPTAVALPTTTTAPPPTAPAAPQLPTLTPPSASGNSQAPQPTATDEPESCLRSVGSVFNWYDTVNRHKQGDLTAIQVGLTSACVDDRRLALWALGSVHEAAGGALLDRYLAAHPTGDWVRAEFDLLPVARAAHAYLNTPQTATDTYAVAPIAIYTTIPTYDTAGQSATKPVADIAPGTHLTLLGRVSTDRTRPDHGGETLLVFERVRRAGDAQTYLIDVSQYVASEPQYFAPPQPAQP